MEVTEFERERIEEKMDDLIREVKEYQTQLEKTKEELDTKNRDFFENVSHKVVLLKQKQIEQENIYLDELTNLLGIIDGRGNIKDVSKDRILSLLESSIKDLVRRLNDNNVTELNKRYKEDKRGFEERVKSLEKTITDQNEEISKKDTDVQIMLQEQEILMEMIDKLKEIAPPDAPNLGPIVKIGRMAELPSAKYDLLKVRKIKEKEQSDKILQLNGIVKKLLSEIETLKQAISHPHTADTEMVEEQRIEEEVTDRQTTPARQQEKQRIEEEVTDRQTTPARQQEEQKIEEEVTDRQTTLARQQEEINKQSCTNLIHVTTIFKFLIKKKQKEKNLLLNEIEILKSENSKLQETLIKIDIPLKTKDKLEQFGQQITQMYSVTEKETMKEKEQSLEHEREERSLAEQKLKYMEGTCDRYLQLWIEEQRKNNKLLRLLHKTELKLSIREKQNNELRTEELHDTSLMQTLLKAIQNQNKEDGSEAPTSFTKQIVESYKTLSNMKTNMSDVLSKREAQIKQENQHIIKAFKENIEQILKNNTILQENCQQAYQDFETLLHEVMSMEMTLKQIKIETIQTRNYLEMESQRKVGKKGKLGGIDTKCEAQTEELDSKLDHSKIQIPKSVVKSKSADRKSAMFVVDIPVAKPALSSGDSTKTGYAHLRILELEKLIKEKQEHTKLKFEQMRNLMRDDKIRLVNSAN